MTDYDDLRALQRQARADHAAGRLGRPVAKCWCAVPRNDRDGRCNRRMGEVYRLESGHLFLVGRVLMGSRPYSVVDRDDDGPPAAMQVIINRLATAETAEDAARAASDDDDDRRPDELPVSRILDRRLADDERGVVTISCRYHYSLPVNLEMLAAAVEGGARDVALNPRAYDGVSRPAS